MNRDLTKRVRTVPGLTQDKKVVRNDIKLAAKIMTNLDTKWSLWTPEDNEESVSLGLMSANPLLANITDYLIEEASAEEEVIRAEIFSEILLKYFLLLQVLTLLISLQQGGGAPGPGPSEGKEEAPAPAPAPKEGANAPGPSEGKENILTS